MHKPKRKIVARRRRSRRDKEAAWTAEDIRRFDRTEPTPTANEIQLMTAEERKIYVRPSTD